MSLAWLPPSHGMSWLATADGGKTNVPRGNIDPFLWIMNGSFDAIHIIWLNDIQLDKMENFSRERLNESINQRINSDLSMI